MTTETITGIGASILTGVSMLPQLLKVLKEKKAEDISYTMLSVLMAGLAGWVFYGFLIKDYIIIVANSFSLAINIILVLAAYKFKKS